VPRKSMESLTESMFYVLMALMEGAMCGIEIAAYLERRTARRMLIGPATLYTILGKFEKEGYIREIEVIGRKRTYAITEQGKQAYLTELSRLRCCVRDAEDAEAERRRQNGNA